MQELDEGQMRVMAAAASDRMELWAAFLQRLGVRSMAEVGVYRGDFAEATADLARVISADQYTYPSLFLFLAQSRAGRPVLDLEAAERRMNSQDWPYAVFELYLGRRDVAATLDAAQTSDQRCEAHFYVGEWLIVQGERPAAKQHLEETVATCPKAFIEHTGAQAELGRLGQ